MISNENEQVLEKVKQIVRTWQSQGIESYIVKIANDADDTIIFALKLPGIVDDVELKVKSSTNEVEVLGKTGWDAVEVLEYLDENIKR